MGFGLKQKKEALTNKTGIFNFIKAYFLDEFEIPESKILPEAGLLTDLDLDSIDTFNMASMLEMEMEIEIKNDELKNIVTIQDIVDFIMTKSSPETATSSELKA